MFILERAVVQFEPDDIDYIRVAQRTFDHILETKSFRVLKSTRHFGPMAFYYCVNNVIDELLVHIIRHEAVEDAQLLINIYYLVHDQLKADYEKSSLNAMDAVKVIIKMFSRRVNFLSCHALFIIYSSMQKKAQRRDM